MGSRDRKVRMNVGGDRLSNLPDDLIHRILSFIGVRHAIQTSALSSRWRYIWTSMPCLDFSSENLFMFFGPSNFVTHVLSSRNNQIDVYSVKLAFHGEVSQAPVKMILDYAFSHNVQQLDITFLRGKKIEFPFSLFSSQSLKHLSLIGYSCNRSIMTQPHWELPALASLNLRNFTLYYDNTDKNVGLFSNCANLKILTLKHCNLVGLNGFSICHPGLSSLTLEDGFDDVNVVTPQLKNLVIKDWEGIYLISTPNLSSLHYKDGLYPLEISAHLPRLEKVDICIPNPYKRKENARKIVCMLQYLNSVKFLTLNLEIIELLSSFVELISHQPSPFSNLRSLKIYPDDITDEEQTQSEVTMSPEVKNYLLDGSPGATFTMVSHEDMRALINFALAQKLMREFQVELDRMKEKELDRMKENHQIDATDLESHMTTVHEQVEVENRTTQPDTKMEGHFGKRMAHIVSYWEGLNEQLENGYKNAGRTISTLQRIERILTKLPTSLRDKLQAKFSGLCEAADTIMDNMMDHLKIKCDKKPRFKCLVS